MYDDLKGKTALVTGSGQGIGRGIALGFAAEGCDVAINVRASLDKAEETAEMARALGVRATVHQADIADRDAVFGMVDDVVSQLGKIDILVNNAGSNTDKGKSFEEVDFADFSSWLESGLNGTVHCCQAVSAPEASSTSRRSRRGGRCRSGAVTA
jgi:NAD(P)-dependent dehydrogenase (short-subunit alcohol dehydrogenase family)